MQSLFHYVAPPGRCSYLPWETASLEYEMVVDLSAPEYMQRMLDGWRRFGGMMFRPRCPHCTGCRALRVDVARFRPNRSQRRACRLNENEIAVQIGMPGITSNKLRLYDRYHAFQADLKGWAEHPPKDAASYSESYINNPKFTEEWCYYLEGALIGVGYVDNLPGGLSAIYFYYDPDLRHRSLGTWNVMRVLEEAKRRGLPHVYLGYYVDGCGSLAYKANFRPNQIRWPDGVWRDFLD
jgi:arginyl-tRNA--protein-N-Asp/Glu arginylyltransferase